MTLRFLARRLMEQADDGASGGSGSGSGSGGSGDGKPPVDGGKSGEGDNKGKTDDKSGTPPGGPKLTDKEAELLREVMDKKTKLKDLTGELTKASERLKLFDGLDADEVKKLVAEAKDRATKDLEAKGQWDALKAQIVSENQKVVDGLSGKLTAAEAALNESLKKIADLTVGTSFGQSKFVAEKVALPVSKLRALYGQHFEFDGEKVVGYDKPAGANGRVQLVDAKGEPLSFDLALEKLLSADPDRDSLIRATMKPGASSTTEARGNQAQRAAQPALSGRGLIAAALNKK